VREIASSSGRGVDSRMASWRGQALSDVGGADVFYVAVWEASFSRDGKSRKTLRGCPRHRLAVAHLEGRQGVAS
jgi:hypothetical protein